MVEQISIRNSNIWLLLMRWFLSKLGKFAIGKLEEEIEFMLA